jgi:hypothetical protein
METTRPEIEACRRPAGSLIVNEMNAVGYDRLPGALFPLRIVRGTLRNENGAIVFVCGEGFTFAKSGTADSTITFTTPFAAPPTITLAQELGPSSNSFSSA